MSFWSFLGSNHGTNLVLTIGSSQVSAAVFRMVNKKPEILAVSKSDIVLGEHLNFGRFMISTRNAIEETLKKIQQLTPRPRKVYCILASPWYVAQTRLINYKAEKSFTVSPSFLQSIISKEAQNFEKDQRRGRSIVLGAENQIIEAITMKTLLNGYETGKPFGKKVGSLSLSTFFSLASQKILKSFADTIHKIFHHLRSDIIFHTLPAAAFNVIRGHLSASPNFLLVEIGGEITDVLLSHRGVIEEVISFPLGENFLYRSISTRFATLPKEAISLARSYLEGALSDKEKLNLVQAIDHVKIEWLKSFKKVLELSSLEYLLPSKCFILANITAGAFFKNFIADESIVPFTSDNKLFENELLDGEMLKDSYLNPRGGPLEAFQTIPVLFVSRLI